MNINQPETYTRMLCSLPKGTTATRIMIPPRMLDIVNDSSITTPARAIMTTGSNSKIMIDIAHLN